MDYGAARVRAQEAEDQLDLSEPVSLDPDRVIKALKRTDFLRFLSEFELTAELLADRLAARTRRSQQRAGGQPGNFGTVFG
jgi:hypothetical protein